MVKQRLAFAGVLCGLGFLALPAAASFQCNFRPHKPARPELTHKPGTSGSDARKAGRPDRAGKLGKRQLKRKGTRPGAAKLKAPAKKLPAKTVAAPE